MPEAERPQQDIRHELRELQEIGQRLDILRAQLQPRPVTTHRKPKFKVIKGGKLGIAILGGLAVLRRNREIALSGVGMTGAASLIALAVMTSPSSPPKLPGFPDSQPTVAPELGELPGQPIRPLDEGEPLQDAAPVAATGVLARVQVPAPLTPSAPAIPPAVAVPTAVPDAPVTAVPDPVPSPSPLPELPVVEHQVGRGACVTLPTTAAKVKAGTCKSD